MSAQIVARQVNMHVLSIWQKDHEVDASQPMSLAITVGMFLSGAAPSLNSNERNI